MTVSTITYNASTGSDTAASGAGPATAVTGSSATNGAGSVVNLDGSPDLSGVAVNDILWVNSATTNRHLSRITAVDDSADTVTTEDLLVLSTGVSWAIGGKRQTLENDTGNPDFEDGKAGWKFDMEAGTYTITGSITLPDEGDTTNGPLEIAGAGIASTQITWTTAFSAFVNSINGHIYLHDFNMLGTNALVTNRCMYIVSSPYAFYIENVKFDSYGDALYINTNGYITCIGCEFVSDAGRGFRSAGRTHARLVGCVAHDCGGSSGFDLQVAATYSTSVAISCVAYDNTNDGFELDVAQSNFSGVVMNCVAHDNGGDGISILGTPVELNQIIVKNCILTKNGGYGIGADAADNGLCVYNDYNAFGAGTFANTSGEVNTSYLTKGPNSISLGSGVDPYTDEAGDDYTLGSGGTDCKDAGLGYDG